MCVPEDSIGKRIATYRRRRGMSQAALAGLVGRSESWLSQVERGVRSVDRMSVLLDLSRLLHVDVQALTGTPWQLAPNGGQRAEGIEHVRTALNQYTSLLGGGYAIPELAELRRSASEAHSNYQAARYSSVVREVPTLIANADAALQNAGPDDREAALSYVETYVVASKLLTKLGVGDLGAVTADRAAMAAGRANSASAQGMAVYQVVTALLRSDQVDQAEQLAMRMTAQLGPAVRSDDPALVSVTGALWLIAAVIAARRTEQWEAERRLTEASALADLLGHDANYAWTAFGPTNVAIHRVSVAAELGNPGAALDAAAAVDLDALPAGLLSRRAQVNLDLAWAQAQRRRDAEATLNLLAAEKAAPEAVAQNVVAREIMRTMLARAKRGNGNALQALAARSGVLD
ncbi:helix-turn-helix domain-containing protein [Pseudonocardia sp. EV170527-09]|uniref:helix-turn-helix domain-containing protein n=1 Tax=Pseudonocardia sp. EV170527-09 TaxID=2603411 RepID=UPI0034CF6F3C